ncbi:high-affinity choline transporter 1-like isoform X1 [Haliotis rufescens]|uniref:high-affinity choline transporter 1-like isoform X1 n=1 Tax=Haliotis rufescens TaxID=6454 RepID=UPI00201FAEA0|nr:high-affinity choline transporter 1-like isoform X1 [Haliotis rufescens]
MAVNVAGLISVIVFYILILIIGIIAARKSRNKSAEDSFVANRSMGLILSCFTLTATNVGGGYINGTAEAMAYSGLIWTNAPILYAVSIVIAGVFYAPKMRRAGYVTMFDPIQAKLGDRAGSLLFFPQLMGDVFWTAAILSALGSTTSIILDLDPVLSIIVSTCVAVFYTFIGGLYSVAYTDVIQLICLCVGLVVACPFAFFHPSVDLTRVQDTWVGGLPTNMVGLYADLCCQLIFGGLSWQAFYQRVLACKTPSVARTSSILASIASLLLAIPPAAIGIVGAAADWNATTYTGDIPIPTEYHSFILPMVLNYLCPLPVGVLGLGVVAAAVMSSADSAVLSSGTIFAKNIYKDVLRPQASDREVMWVMRGGILVTGTLSCVLAILVKSVYGLFYLCSDLMYVILFPQLTCILWIGFTNTYGALTGYALSLFLRVAAGDTLLGIPALIHFPWYTETDGQLFPIRTLMMIVNFVAIIFVSAFTRLVFRRGWLSTRCDVFNVMKREEDSKRPKGLGESLMMKEQDDGNRDLDYEHNEKIRPKEYLLQ